MNPARPALTAAVVLTALVAVPLALAPAGASATDAPAFTSYAAPASLGNSAGEPTIGISAKTGAVFFQAGSQALKVTGFDAAGPGKATWTQIPTGLSGTISLDPILETDPVTGRTFVSQLTAACSNGGYTDDEGATFTAVPLECGPGAFFDHQDIGTGAFVKGGLLKPVGAYPTAVYYCAQDVLSANCSVSLDGGDTYPVTRKAYTLAECSGLFGHLKSAPDGTIYLPPINCGGLAGVAVSSDNGLTWRTSRVPGSRYGDSGHPSVGVGNDGTAYLAYGSRQGSGPGGPLQVAVTKDKAATWSAPVTVGAELGIQNVRFPLAVAGDAGRAAVAFLGTTTPGNASDINAFQGRWDLYVAFTSNSGATWRTTRATTNAVQVGSVCTAGTTCGSDRNLLDFNDMDIDPRTGRVVVGYADGCPSASCTPATRSRKATLTRQTAGPSLLAAHDPAPAPTEPALPALAALAALPVVGLLRSRRRS